MEDRESAELLEWASSAGITDASLASSTNGSHPGRSLGASLGIASFPLAGGRGLAAVRDIEEGELILRVPDGALMNVRSAREDPVLSKALLRHPKLSSEQILTVHLLREVSRKSESRWFPYLVHLPRVHHCLSHFSEDEAESLQVGDAVWTAKQTAKKVRQSWREAQGLLKELGLPPKLSTVKAWLWASATISSRTLHVPWDPAGTLCPVGDLFNYAAPGANVWRANREEEGQDAAILNQDGASSCTEDVESEDEEDGSGLELKDRLRDGGYEPEHHAFCFYSRQRYREGEQVLLCYGQYSNLELLEHYGFLLPDNPNDNLHIALPSSTELLGDLSWFPEVHPDQLYLHVDGRPSFSLLSTLRQQAASPIQRKSHGHLAKSGMQISVEGDVWVYQWLFNRCQSLLGKLPTNLAEDTLLLNVICSRGSKEEIGEDKSFTSSDFPISMRAQEELRKFSRLLLGDEDDSHQARSECRLERWKLAVQWRLGYKQVLNSCLTYSRKKLHRLQTRQPAGANQYNPSL